jgi:hypothetical protein
MRQLIERLVIALVGLDLALLSPNPLPDRAAAE